VSRRIAANPIPYWASAGKTREVFATAFADFQEIGFTAVKADVPDDMTASEYREWIAGYGLTPALSLFNSPFDETVELAAEVEKARRFAAVQVELGLDRTMVSSMARPERLAQPAVGAGFSPARLDRAIEMCGEVCRVLQAEGLRPLHHSHVGGIFETEHEITRLLDDLGPDVIGLGPDTGHLRWAGIEPAGSSAATPTGSAASTSRTSFPICSTGATCRTVTRPPASGCGPSPAWASWTSTACWPRSRPPTTATS